jgi:hypothetical protein
LHTSYARNKNQETGLAVIRQSQTFKRKTLDYKKYVETMPATKKAQNQQTSVPKLTTCQSAQSTKTHTTASRAQKATSSTQFNNIPDGMTTDQLLASIEEIEKQVVLLITRF